MYHINHMPRVIELGTIGDNHFKTIEIDMTPWLHAIPRGVASIIHIRPGETEADAYITATDMVHGILMWEPVAGDLGDTEGYGSMQIWLEDVASNRGKSVTVQTYVRRSIVSPGDIPEPQENWMEQMTALKVATVENAEDAADSAADAADSMAAAASSESAAAASEAAAAASETAAALSETNAANSATSAAGDASSAAASAAAASASETSAGASKTAAATSATAAATSETNAATSATAAAGSATAAASSKSDAEAWAVGKRNGVPVDSADATYHNNSKYYAENAAEIVPDAVAAWLDAHPEATTTVQDKSLSVNKLINGTLGYVTPEMYGAIGDGATDDSTAVQAAFDSGFNVILTKVYFCGSTITIPNAAELTISGINYNNSQLKFGDNAQLIIGGTSNVNELRMNNLSIVGNRTQTSVLKIQYITNVMLNQVNVVEGGTCLVELDHADIVFINGCTFAGSNIMDIWQPCAGIKMTSANPVYITNCNVWNVTNAFEIGGITRTVNITRNWIEFANHVVHASGITMQNCNIEVKENNISFSPHGTSPSFLNSRIVYLNNITTGFDILIDVIGNYINYYTAYPTQALVELNSVPSYVCVNILKNNMFTRLQQMSAYALKVDAKNSTKLNYESTTNADAPYGCATAGITDVIKSPLHNNLMNLNIVSDQKDVTANRSEGDIWWEGGWLYIQDSSAVRSVVISQSETITNLPDPSTATTYDIAAKLNALMNILRRTKIVRN